MPKVNDRQIRGMLLEEAVLYLLRFSGYRTVKSTEVHRDPTLTGHSAGIAVHGRGEKHQIDAIADFCVSPPFGYPMRLLLEAKCYKSPVGIAVIRNAVGVIKDVSEFWINTPDTTGNRVVIPHRRYHYQYAVFSTSGYTTDAQRYGFAQDIFLIPLADSRQFESVIYAIDQVGMADFGDSLSLPGSLSRLRADIRTSLNNAERDGMLLEDISNHTVEVIQSFITSVHSVRSAYLATLQSRFVIFLVPTEEWIFQVRNQELPARVPVQIWRDDNGGWLIGKSIGDGRRTPLFSFDLPEEMVRLYNDNNLLNSENAWDLKKQFFRQVQLVHVDENGPRIYWLDMDGLWFQARVLWIESVHVFYVRRLPLLPQPEERRLLGQKSRRARHPHPTLQVPHLQQDLHQKS